MLIFLSILKRCIEENGRSKTYERLRTPTVLTELRIRRIAAKHDLDAESLLSDLKDATDDDLNYLLDEAINGN